MQASAARPRARGTGRLLAVLGVGFGLAVTVGNTIGSGILRTPGEVAAQLPSVWLFLGIWVLGGVYAALGANALAELSAMTPASGGYTVFVRRALGDVPGFVVGWSDWLATCGSLAAAALVIGEYSGALVPALAGRSLAIALAVVIAFGLLQWRGVRTASHAQELTSALKAIAFLALIAACFLLGGGSAPADAAAAAPPPLPSGPAFLVAFVLSMQAVIFTYDGYYGIVYFAGEVRDPGRDIPRSMFGGLAAVVAIYLLVNAALLVVVPLPEMAGEELVAGKAATVLFGARGDTVLRSLVILSLLSSINAFQLMASRTFYAVSASGLFPAGERVNEGGTPTVALLASSIASALFLLSGTFEKVIAVTAFFFVANYSLAFLSVFALRRREPHAPRPFRARAHPWTTGIVLLGSLVFLAGAIAADTRNSVWALVLLVASLPLFRVLRRVAERAASS